MFPPTGEVVNLNCSEHVIQDRYFLESFGDENTYKNYYRAICNMFPVTSSGSDTNIIMEILYTVEVM